MGSAVLAWMDGSHKFSTAYAKHRRLPSPRLVEAREVQYAYNRTKALVLQAPVFVLDPKPFVPLRKRAPMPGADEAKMARVSNMLRRRHKDKYALSASYSEKSHAIRKALFDKRRKFYDEYLLRRAEEADADQRAHREAEQARMDQESMERLAALADDGGLSSMLGTLTVVSSSFGDNHSGAGAVARRQ